MLRHRSRVLGFEKDGKETDAGQRTARPISRESVSVGSIKTVANSVGSRPNSCSALWRWIRSCCMGRFSPFIPQYETGLYDFRRYSGVRRLALEFVVGV